MHVGIIVCGTKRGWCNRSPMYSISSSVMIYTHKLSLSNNFQSRYVWYIHTSYCNIHISPYYPSHFPVKFYDIVIPSLWVSLSSVTAHFSNDVPYSWHTAILHTSSAMTLIRRAACEPPQPPSSASITAASVTLLLCSSHDFLHVTGLSLPSLSPLIALTPLHNTLHHHLLSHAQLTFLSPSHLLLR